MFARDPVTREVKALLLLFVAGLTFSAQSPRSAPPNAAGRHSPEQSFSQFCSNILDLS